MKKLALSIVLALAASVLIVMVALANPPDRIELTNNTPYPIADCGDFAIINYPDYTLDLTFFYDNEGDLERVNQLWYGTDNLTNSVSGNVITSAFRNFAAYDMNDVTVHQGGVFWHVTSPHEGPVFFLTGHYIALDYDQPDATVTFTGVANLDTATLCALLSD